MQLEIQNFIQSLSDPRSSFRDTVERMFRENGLNLSHMELEIVRALSNEEWLITVSCLERVTNLVVRGTIVFSELEILRINRQMYGLEILEHRLRDNIRRDVIPYFLESEEYRRAMVNTNTQRTNFLFRRPEEIQMRVNALPEESPTSNLTPAVTEASPVNTLAAVTVQVNPTNNIQDLIDVAGNNHYIGTFNTSIDATVSPIQSTPHIGFRYTPQFLNPEHIPKDSEKHTDVKSFLKQHLKIRISVDKSDDEISVTADLMLDIDEKLEIIDSDSDTVSLDD